MLLIDFFCKAGGTSVGYSRAGFAVVGVDIEPQRNYPGEFVQMDALEAIPRMRELWPDAVAAHASPPCQGYSRMNSVHKRDYPLLIEPVRDALQASGLPYVIENVEGAPLVDPITLCGSSFGLKVLRHRLFESNVPLSAPPCGSHVGEFYSPAGHGDPNWRHREKNPHLKGKGYTDRCRAAMGISWMNRDELAEAIPPAYTEHIGRQLYNYINGGGES
jgi:DNA (cytosine-5)-methyltransferase 1